MAPSQNNEPFTITVRMGTSERFIIGDGNIKIISSSSVGLIKQIISTLEASGNCPVEQQRLIFKGRILNNDIQTIGDYGIKENLQVLHLVKSSSRAIQQQERQQSTSAASDITSNVTSAASNPLLGLQEGMIQQPLTNGNLNFGNQSNNGNGMIDQMRQSLQNNPEALSNMMNSMNDSPIFQNMLSDPNFMQNAMNTNPEMQGLLDSNPELRQMFNDPDFLRSSMEMMRDPSAMRNMMRNQDLAMSQIENTPGGFSALRRMYEDVQEPMMDAMGGGREENNDESGNRDGQHEGSGAAGMAMPNPWGNGERRHLEGNNTHSNNNNPTQQFSPHSSSVPHPFNPWSDNSNGSSSMDTRGDNSFPFNNFLASSSPAATSSSSLPASNINGTPPHQQQQVPRPPDLSTMLENPALNQAVRSIMSDPEAVRALMEASPRLQNNGIGGNGGDIASIMSNPGVMRAAMNPAVMRALAGSMGGSANLGEISSTLSQNFGRQHLPRSEGIVGGFSPTPTASAARTASGPGVGTVPDTGLGGLDFSNLLNQFESSASLSSTSNSNISSSPATLSTERYRKQLHSLRDMGFKNDENSIRVLDSVGGNVNRAIDALVSSPSPSPPPPPPPPPRPTQPQASSNVTDGTVDQLSSSTSDVGDCEGSEGGTGDLDGKKDL